MARIYRKTDRIQINIGELKVKIAPLDLHQKGEVQKMMMDGHAKADIKMMNDSILLALSYCVKEIEGLIDSDNQPYKLKIENERLTEECVGELTNMEFSAELLKVVGTFVNGIPKELKIDGVSFADEKKTETTASSPI